MRAVSFEFFDVLRGVCFGSSVEFETFMLRTLLGSVTVVEFDAFRVSLEYGVPLESFGVTFGDRGVGSLGVPFGVFFERGVGSFGVPFGVSFERGVISFGLLFDVSFDRGAVSFRVGRGVISFGVLFDVSFDRGVVSFGVTFGVFVERGVDSFEVERAVGSFGVTFDVSFGCSVGCFKTSGMDGTFNSLEGSSFESVDASFTFCLFLG